MIGSGSGAQLAPTVSVVIPSFSRTERIAPLLAEYRRQGADEIVIVLDGPHPGWQAHLPVTPGAAVHVVELPENVGLALARISGLRAASGDVVLTVDDDVVPEPGLVERHRAFHTVRGDKVLLGYMPVALPPHRHRDDAATYLYARDYEQQAASWRRGDSADILGSLWGGNLSLPRELYERAEDLKPSQRLEYNEDLDLGIRLQQLGATAAFDPDARASHHHARGLAGYLRECVARGGAVADLEDRWGTRPAQLTPLIEIPRRYNRVLAALQRHIASRDDRGALEQLCVGIYTVAGVTRLWALQDGVARLLRRALAMRGYRLARSASRDLATVG